MQDKVLKVWDVAGEAPVFVTERDLKLGELHDCAPCPDAPFVMVMGGDKTSDNLKVSVNIVEFSGVKQNKANAYLMSPYIVKLSR